jgi:hypothetical protein
MLNAGELRIGYSTFEYNLQYRTRNNKRIASTTKLVFRFNL